MDLDDPDTRMDDDDENEYENHPSENSTRKHYDEAEEVDEEEDEVEHKTRRKKKKRKGGGELSGAHYLDLDAIDDDDEGDEDEDEEAEAGFLLDQPPDEEEDEDPERAAANALLDRQRLHEQELSSEEIARRLRERYARNDQIIEEFASVPQRMLMPSVNDANLWQIKVKPGRERDIVLSLYRKTLDFQFRANPLQIISAFERTSLPGFVYVEARSKEAVMNACANLVGIFRRDPILVPINEMAPLLQLKRKEINISPGMWVRIKRGKYQGDLAEVVDITDNGEEAGVRFLPRIDMNPKEAEIGADGKAKRKRQTAAIGRPPARPFNPEEVLRIYGKKSALRKGQSWIFQGDTYTNGFVEKDIRVSALSLENVNPTLAEIGMFAGGKDGLDKTLNSTVNLNVLAEAARRSAVVALQPGDNVEVFQGEQSGAQGVVDSVLADVVTIRASGTDLDGQMIEVPARDVRKRFSAGDHIKVMSGQNADETGMVVDVKGDLVTFLSDLTEQQITVFSKDLRTAAEVGSSSNIVGNYELHELVQLDTQTVGVIFRTERDSFSVLDQHGQTRLLQPHQITMRRDSKRAISTDAEGNELRVGDNVKEIDGQGRRGVVLHIHQAFFAFLQNREIIENGGIFVTRCRSLAPIAPKGGVKMGGIDSRSNPLGVTQGGAPSMTRGPRDRLIGTNIKIIKGVQKGYMGTIKDVNGPHCRVELSTNNKIITIEKEKLRRIGANGQLEQLEGPGGFVRPQAPSSQSNNNNSSWGTPSQSGRTPNPYNVDGGRTPGWGASGRTPNPYDRRTPSWAASSSTPNHYADGGRTPGWNPSSRTPGWNASSRTPNPYNDLGSKTPQWQPEPRASTFTTRNEWSSGSNGRDSGARANRDASNSWDDSDSAPTPHASSSAPTPYASAATPYTAPTPYASASTPYTSAPTPYASAATPAAAPTPAAYSAHAETPGYIAPTPAGISAPTPAGYGASFTPAAYPAATPGPGETPMAMQEFRRPPIGISFKEHDRWLLEFRVPNINAKFKDTTGWFNGMHDQRPVRVLSVLETRDELTSTATVQFMEGDDAGNELGGVPIRFLRPLHPDKRSFMNRNAILLQNHMRQGPKGPEVAGAKLETVLLRAYDDPEWLCGRVSVPNAADIEVGAANLCLVG